MATEARTSQVALEVVVKPAPAQALVSQIAIEVVVTRVEVTATGQKMLAATIS